MTKETNEIKANLKEGGLYTCEKTGTVVMVVKAGSEPVTTLSTELGPLTPHTSVVCDDELADAAGQPCVRPGVIIRDEVSLAHELADGSHPVTGLKAKVTWGIKK